MKPWQIEKAIAELCRDVERLVDRRDYTAMSEKDLSYELLICILGSGVRYELSLAYADKVQSKDILRQLKNSNSLNNYKTQVQEILSSQVFSSLTGKIYQRYRYPQRAANHIVESFHSIYCKYESLSKMIASIKTPSLLRRELIILCPGIGPKQSSHYIKNIGLTDNIAILDRHIINYLRIIERLDVCLQQVRKIDQYEEVERRFIDRVSRFNHSVSVVDQSMWFVMRALGKEAFL